MLLLLALKHAPISCLFSGYVIWLIERLSTISVYFLYAVIRNVSTAIILPQKQNENAQVVHRTKTQFPTNKVLFSHATNMRVI
jgi:hypothetical protein